MDRKETLAAEWRNPLGSFLRARRALVSPDQHGLAVGNRRVPGLRREEVAELAGVSTHYYIRLEQGRDRHPSSSVLDALGRVLCLDRQARAHLDRLSEAGSTPGCRLEGTATVRSELVDLIGQWTHQACLVLGPYRDVLAANALATAINPSFTPGHNLLREVFLDPQAHTRYPDWEQVAEQGVAALRAAVGANPADQVRDRLVHELSDGSATFERLWSEYHVREKPRGRQRFWTPEVGTIELQYEPLLLSYDMSLTMYIFFAAQGSPAGSQLRTLATNP